MLKIEAKNFRSYPSLYWEFVSGLTLIDGENKDSGGSNMSGKTTLCDSWFWARYGWLPKWGGPKGGSVDAVVKRGEKSCYVDVTEKFGPDEIRYRRERPNKFTVWKNGVEQIGMDQVRFEEMLGMSPSRFLLCVYIPQKRKNSFFHMGDKERTEMLSVIAGLEELDKGLFEAKNKRDQIKSIIERYEGSISVYDAQLAEIPTKKEKVLKELSFLSSEANSAKTELCCAEADFLGASTRLTEENKVIVQDYCQKILVKTEALDEEIKSLLEKKISLQSSITAHTVESDIVNAVLSAKNELEEAKKLKEEKEQAEKHNQRVQDKIRREKDLADSSRHGKCSSCNQSLPEWDINAKVKKHLEEAEKLEHLMRPIPIVPDISSLEFSLEEANKKYLQRKFELEQRPNQIKLEVQTFESKILQLVSEKKRIETEQKQFILESTQKLNKRIAEEKEKVTVHEQKYSAASSAASRKSEEFNTIDAQEKEFKSKLFSLRKTIDDERQRFNLCLDLIDLCGPKGYRAVCFDGLVNRIGDRAGELLQLMTDGLYTTRLEQIGTDSKGNQKLILKPVVMKGSQEVPLDDLSGGAEDRIALAYDISVSEAAGDGLPLLLDEVLKGIDEVGKSEAMVLLEEVSKTRPVLVIDHTTEFKAMFTQVIKILYENEESRIVGAELPGETYNQVHG